MFDGDKFEVNSDNSVSGVKDFGVSLLVNTTDSNATLLSQGEEYALRINETGNIEFTSNGVTAISKAVINDGNWNDITAVRENNGLLKIYVNGELDSSAFDESLGIKDIQKASIIVGSEEFTGAISNIIVRDVALAYDEVETVFEEDGATEGNKIPQSKMTVTATSEENGSEVNLKENAIDGNTTTFWQSAVAKDNTVERQYLTLDLGKLYNVSQVDYTGRYHETLGLNCTGNILEYVIETSVNGETWTEASTGATSTESATTEITFEPVEAQYVRISANTTYHWQDANRNKTVSVAELNVYGDEVKDEVVEATNVALNKNVTGFWTTDNSAVNVNSQKPLSNIVSGNKELLDYADFGTDNRAESSYVQIDLEGRFDIDSMNLYRYWSDGRTYNGTVIAVSETADFAESTIVYNSDTENFHGLGVGTDSTYAETAEGKTIDVGNATGRYVRVYMHGSSTGNTNHIVELEVMGIESEETPEIPEETQAGINMTVAEEVTVGNDFNVNVNLSDIKENMYAMEFEVDYDETKVDFKEGTSIDPAKYMVQTKAQDGKVKVVVAGLGAQLENAKDIVKLTFTAKASGENVAFDLINGKVANGEGAEEATKTSSVTTTIKDAVNKSELTATIDRAKAIIENESDKYTEVTINDLKEAVKLAEEVVANEAATQEQVDVAKSAVENAINGLKEVEKPEVSVDKTALKITIDYANELKDGGVLEGVVPAVVKEFNEALAEAQAVYANADVTEAQVKASFDRLTAAIHMLSFEAGDKSELENLINSVGALNKDSYTEESWTNLENVLAEANKVLADENAMQTEVNEVAGKLQQAIEGLVEKPVNTVDKSILQGLVDRVQGTDSTKYIASTWTPFANALEAANAVLGNTDATQEEVNSAYNTLLRAYLGLRLTPDKSLLEGLIKEVESIDLARYTAKSAKAVEKALANANKVLANEEATQEEVNTALSNLEKAKNSLVANSSSSNNNQSSGSNNNSGTASSGNTTGSSSNGKLPQTGTAGVAGTLMGGVIALVGGFGLSRKKNRK